MAGIERDNTTSADWRLASVELAFEYFHSEKAAKELLLGFLDEGSVQWRCYELAIEGDEDPRANPPLVTSIAAARRFFWHRDKNSRIDMDWEASSAIRVGPIMKLGSDGKGNAWPIFDLRGVISVKASLVRFNHPDVVDILRHVGLMPQPSTLLSPSLSPASPPPISPLPATSSPISTAQESAPGQPKPLEKPNASSLAPQPAKRITLDSWLPGAIKKHPRQEGEKDADYAERLRLHGPKWKKKSIQNALIGLARENRSSKKK
jgi:hypothetical protein